MKDSIKQFILRRFFKQKGWDKFKDDYFMYGCMVTDKDGNRVDPLIAFNHERKKEH